MLRALLCSLALSPLALLAQAKQQATQPSSSGAAWRTSSVHESSAGVWYANVSQVVAGYGQPEIVATDDDGRLLVFSVYSGNWTTHSVTCDGLWLAPSRPSDVDPRIPGNELYAAGRAGSIHQVTLRPQPFARFTLESREIAHVAGEEFHAIIAADLIPGGSDELLVFGITGAVYQLIAGPAGQNFTIRKVATVPGRVRDVIRMSPNADANADTSGDASGDASVAMLGASRSGHLLRMTLSESGLAFAEVLHEDCGLGRIASSPNSGIYYVTRDDGILLRVAFGTHATPGINSVDRQVLYAGGQGLRGVAAGRFFADQREAVAVYGYDQRVHMIVRQPDGEASVETIYRSKQRGHWLTVGELDGRNGTDELVATGFDGAVVLLARSPGYALAGAAVPEELRELSASERRFAGKRPLRIAARIGEQALTELSPLCYQGGFESKALVYETLVRRGPDGRIVPGLATSWRVEQDGCVFVFQLRESARWHDGEAVVASDVATHFRRWIGLPEHDWLSSSAHIVKVQATGPHEVRIELDQPSCLLADLCAINPTAVVGPRARNKEGDFVQAIGSGPYALVEVREQAQVLRYQRQGSEEQLDLYRGPGDPLDLLLEGTVDAVVGSWLVPVDPARARALAANPRFVVTDGPGSSVLSLTLRWDQGELVDLAKRRAVAAAIDREELVSRVWHGFADATTAYAAPSVVDWPRGKHVASATAAFGRPLRFDAKGADPALVKAIVEQLRSHKIAVEVLPVDRSDLQSSKWDLRIERSHGVPYDPFTVIARFGGARQGAVDPQLATMVADLAATSDESDWPGHYTRIQRRLDELLPIVPLLAPRRIAIVPKGRAQGSLDHDLYRLPTWLR
tara:strand:- start:44002 stop:46575 length:2574 start_codon:yes stop_codon:yes gene_type:complete